MNYSVASPAALLNNAAMRARGMIGRSRDGAGRAACLAAALLLWAGLGGARAGAEPASADTPADLAFRSALKLFVDGQYPLAESSLSSFLNTFTNYPHRANAVLYLARSRLEQSNYTGASELLTHSFGGASDLALEYVFWTAKARLGEGDYQHAAEGFANVATMPSPHRLEASYDEAEAYARQGQWARVINLLQPADGLFGRAAAAEATNEFASMGVLLLGEAFFSEHRYAEGEQALGRLAPAALTADMRWHRQYLLCQMELADGHAADALEGSGKLLDAAYGREHVAAGLFLRGEILEKLGRPAEALQAYTNNLVDSLTADDRRRALTETVRLTVALNPPAAAIAALESLIAGQPRAPGQEAARLSLGELYLKAYASPSGAAPAPTNLLEKALTNFDIVIGDFTNSPLTAKAHLDRGWCGWLGSNVAQAKADFEQAAAHLPYGEDQAEAVFKLADAQFEQGNYAGAVSNYNRVLEQYDKMPAVTNKLFDQALYQIAEAEINRTNETAAAAAVEKILRWYPDSYFGDRGLLLEAKYWNGNYNYPMAREVFTQLLARAPQTPLLAEVQYAIGRTYDHEGNWSAAVATYNQWMTNHPGHPRLPEVEFHLALDYDKEGRTNEALMRFTNFVARYPTNALAPWAQNWVAEFYFNQDDFAAAEKNYQVLFQKFPGAGDLAYQAQLGAGRAALARQDPDQARIYFAALVSDTNTPAPLAARAYFALGETALQQFQAEPTNETFFRDAIAAISKLTNGAPTNAIAVEALGRLGDYYGLWADLKSDTNVYTQAALMYSNILSFSPASVSVATRCQAEVGLGVIAEKEHNPKEALRHYCNVVYNYDPANFVPYWVERAGEFAARICEDQQQWEQAVNVYRRLIVAVPSKAPVLEKRIAAAAAHITAPGN
jgi:tetratricopeptide (TPR) repeat protein